MKHQKIQKIRVFTGQRVTLAVVIVSIASLGIYVLHNGLAASFYASGEAESGVLAGTAAIQTDTAASKGSSVQFGSGSNKGSGPTYYVSPSGSDSNNGTSIATPWQTIAHVNSVKFSAGANILFLGNSTFDGNLYFAPGENGTLTNPITVSSYGTGEATITAGSGSGVEVYDDGGYVISNLIIMGAGAGSNTGSGINIYNDENATLNYMYVSDVTVSGFQNGYSLGGSNATSGYSDVTVADSIFHDNQLAGLQTYGPTFNAAAPLYVNTNVTITGVTTYNNLGNAALTGSTDSGNGIVLGSVNNATIERSSAYNNGIDCSAEACGVGIWAYDSKDVTIEYNESYDNHTGAVEDGDGFDLDQNTADSVMQYNYSHDNDGAGYLLFGASGNEAHTSNTVRFNISQNDGRKNSYGAIVLDGNVASDSVYNNTVYQSASADGGVPIGIKIYQLGTGTTVVRNNIFYTTGGTYSFNVSDLPTSTSLEFQQNDYYGFIGYWGSTTYTSLASWQSATGQEKLNGSSIGYSVNPDLSDPGGGGTISSASNLTQLTQYQLVSGSLMKNAGINLTSQFGTSIGSYDYYGTPVPSSGGLSIGAAQ